MNKREQATQWPLSEQLQSTAPETSISSLLHDYDYSVYETVALLADNVDNRLPFRIGRLFETHNREGKITRLTVPWYEPKCGRDIYAAAYRPLMITCNGPVKQWTDRVDSTSLMMTFSTLTGQYRIPATVSR